MNEPLLPPESADDTVTCRQCGNLFFRKFGACPKCRTARPHRRPKKRQQVLKDRVEGRLKAGWTWVRRWRYFIIYIGLGLLIGAVSYPTVMWLAEFSMPAGWREARMSGAAPWSLGHFFEPFFGAVHTVLIWAGNALAWIGHFLYFNVWREIVSRPSTLLMVVIGVTVGTVMALRRHRRRRHSRSRPRARPREGAP